MGIKMNTLPQSWHLMIAQRYVEYVRCPHSDKCITNTNKKLQKLRYPQGANIMLTSKFCETITTYVVRGMSMKYLKSKRNGGICMYYLPQSVEIYRRTCSYHEISISKSENLL